MKIDVYHVFIGDIFHNVKDIKIVSFYCNQDGITIILKILEEG